MTGQRNTTENDQNIQVETVKTAIKLSNDFKGLVHPKMKILSVFTHPHVVPTP